MSQQRFPYGLSKEELTAVIRSLLDMQERAPNNSTIASALYLARMLRGDYAQAARDELRSAIAHWSLQSLARSLVYFNSYSVIVARLWLGAFVALGVISVFYPTELMAYVCGLLAALHALVYIGARDLILGGTWKNRVAIVILLLIDCLFNLRIKL